LGELFGTDPILILGSDDEEWLLRISCAMVIQNDRKRQAEEAEKQQNR